jgi:hypothetical protein
VAINIGEKTAQSSKLLNDDETVQICSQPRFHTDAEGKKIPDIEGLDATVVDESTLYSHIGDHLLKVRVPEALLPQIRVTAGAWTQESPRNTIYIKVTDSTLPTRLRMNALNTICPP